MGCGAEWRNPAHPLRVDPDVKLTGIPTLFSWGASGPEQRLGEASKRPGKHAKPPPLHLSPRFQRFEREMH